MKHIFDKRKTSIVALVLLWGCGGTIGGNPEKTGETAPKAASLSFSITDAPVDDAIHVFVKVEALEIKQDEGDWLSIPLKASEEIDLLQLQQGRSEALAALENLPLGTYTETRLILAETGGGRLVDADGVSHDLKIPSGSESGLKIKSSFTLEEGVALNLTIDFDLRKSIKQTGNGNGNGNSKYLLKPVLRLVQDALTGSILGQSDEGVIVCAYESEAAKDSEDSCENAVSSTLVKDGRFHIAFLEPGAYAVRLFKDGQILGDREPIEVKAGENSDIGVVP